MVSIQDSIGGDEALGFYAAAFRVDWKLSLLIKSWCAKQIYSKMNLWTEINLRDDRDYLDYRVKEPFPCSPALTNGWGCMSRIFIKLHPCSVGKKAMINDGCLSQQVKWRVVAHVSIFCALV